MEGKINKTKVHETFVIVKVKQYKVDNMDIRQ